MNNAKELGIRRANELIEEKDLVIIGGGVAGYVAAIKAGQEGLKVRIQKEVNDTDNS